ncbi:MAG: M15 family metallopeptidase, partial [Cytophagales bacterium]|nr:M15 family metallopeptidase [Cytophagales bacterium]
NDEDDSVKIYPESGAGFLDRNLKENGMVESIVSIFAKHGFTDWGGNWESPLDYHHFQLPWDRINREFQNR